MFELLVAWWVIWAVKNAFEDIWSAFKNQPNPRIERSRARAKRRGNNQIWQAFVGWLGDVATDAREEAARRKKELREQQAEARRKRDLEEHPRVDAEYTIDDLGVVDMATKLVDADGNELDEHGNPKSGSTSPDPDSAPRRRHRELADDECTLDWCPFHNKKPAEQQGSAAETKESKMAGQAGGDAGRFLDGAIKYCEEAAEGSTSFGQAEGEGFSLAIQQAKVGGQCLAAVHNAQALSSAAAAAWDEAKAQFEKQKTIQEQYRSNPDAGDKDFQAGG